MSELKLPQPPTLVTGRVRARDLQGVGAPVGGPCGECTGECAGEGSSSLEPCSGSFLDICCLVKQRNTPGIHSMFDLVLGTRQSLGLSLTVTLPLVQGRGVTSLQHLHASEVRQGAAARER